ncbi:hypothetical protein M0813_28333 [Anaeramoeba flamelloides]|uniref:Uncharacterized protein n=1 Tax=Anaeramoeba flamelloides TaxID=1746091 RepID=A0ABQ8XTG0_9EUKA|nr:hypothetical protein M0813_28333 [Anaeramoeba flamelloides]
MIQDSKKNLSIYDQYETTQSPLLLEKTKNNSEKNKPKKNLKKIAFIIFAILILSGVIFCIIYLKFEPRNYCFGYTNKDTNCDRYATNYKTFQFPKKEGWHEIGDSNYVDLKFSGSWKIKIRDQKNTSDTRLLDLQKNECYIVYQTISSSKLCYSEMIARYDTCISLNNDEKNCKKDF